MHVVVTKNLSSYRLFISIYLSICLLSPPLDEEEGEGEGVLFLRTHFVGLRGVLELSKEGKRRDVFFFVVGVLLSCVASYRCCGESVPPREHRSDRLRRSEVVLEKGKEKAPSKHAPS